MSLYMPMTVTVLEGLYTTLSGSVRVKNPSGSLPGNMYYSLPLYGWVSMLWAAAGIIWLVLLITRKDHLIWVHGALALIIVIGFVEGATWWFALTAQARTGEVSVPTVIAQVLSILRAVYTVGLMLVLSSGLGITETTLPKGQKISAALGSIVFAIAVMPKVCSNLLRPQNTPNNLVVIGMTLPVIVVGCIVFLCMLNQIAHSMKRSKELNQADSLKIFQRLAIVTCLYALLSLGIMVGQVLDKPGRGPAYWQTHTFWNDGAGQAVALLSLFFTMYFLAPSASGFLTEAYLSQVNDNEDLGLTEDPEAKPVAANIGATAVSTSPAGSD